MIDEMRGHGVWWQFCDFDPHHHSAITGSQRPESGLSSNYLQDLENK
jgi:hypothetical protein